MTRLNVTTRSIRLCSPPGGSRADALGPPACRNDDSPAADQPRPQAAPPTPDLAARYGMTY
jgi:hypothetical protein